MFVLLMAEKCKLCEIIKRMVDVYGEAWFNQRTVYENLKSTVHGIDTLADSMIKKVLGMVKSKESFADCVQRPERPH